MKNLKGLEGFADQLPATERMPVLFIGHGSPMNAIEENEFTKGFRDVARTLPQPEAIVCVSAHWFTEGTRVTAMEHPETIHDFYGFPKELYQQQYPAKGNPELAGKTQELLKPVMVEADREWGLDHGSWTVLKHLYPNADIPVIQLSIDHLKAAEYHFELARQLQVLRDKGVLVIGSGNIVHNLRMVDWQNFDKDNHGFDWAREARDWVNTHIMDGDFAPLLAYEKQGKAMQLAVPTPDHYLPLIYALGLSRKNDRFVLFNDKLQAGSLSMTSVKIH